MGILDEIMGTRFTDEDRVGDWVRFDSNGTAHRWTYSHSTKRSSMNPKSMVRTIIRHFYSRDGAAEDYEEGHCTWPWDDWVSIRRALDHLQITPDEPRGNYWELDQEAYFKLAQLVVAVGARDPRIKELGWPLREKRSMFGARRRIWKLSYTQALAAAALLNSDQ